MVLGDSGYGKEKGFEVSIYAVQDSQGVCYVILVLGFHD